MIFEAKTVTLKDGRTCIIRSPQASDADAMKDYIKTIAGETDFILRYPEECTETTEQEAAFLDGFIKSPLNMMLCAFIDGKVMGNSQVTLNNRMKTKHRATFAIGIKKEYWNLGLGQIFFAELIHYAKTKGVIQGELAFIEGNKRAQALYEKIGFQVTGELKRAIRLKNGTYLSEFLMKIDLDNDHN